VTDGTHHEGREAHEGWAWWTAPIPFFNIFVVFVPFVVEEWQVGFRRRPRMLPSLGPFCYNPRQCPMRLTVVKDRTRFVAWGNRASEMLHECL